MPDWPRHFVVSAVYTAPHGTFLPFQSRIPAAAGGSAIAHWQQAALIVALSLQIFCCCRAHFLLCVSVVMAPLIEEYLVLLLSLRIITCRSSRHV